METLADYGIHVKPGATGNVKTTCPECSHNRKKKKDPCLSVDVSKGVWHCHNCGYSGAVKEELYEKPPPQPKRKAKGELNTQPLTPDGAKWLADRGISKETAEILNIKSCVYYFPQYNRQGAAVAIPFYKDGEVKNVKIRSIEGKAFAQVKGGQQILYNYDGCVDRNIVVITEGELDTAAIIESGFKGGVCSCPNGAPSESTENLTKKLSFLEDARDIFDQAETVVLAMDNDKPGVNWSEVIAEKVGPEKCRVVTWSTECKDANDVLLQHGPEVLQECLELAKPYPVPGIVQIEECEQDIMQYYDGGGLQLGKSTGWDNLDEYLRIETKTLNILTGIPMSGKSEWLDQLMLHTVKKHGWKWAVYSPENYPIENHFQKLAEKWVGKPMFDFWQQPCMTRDECQGAIRQLTPHVKMLTFGEKPATTDELISRIKVCKYRWGIKGVIIDPYNELDHSRPSSQTESEYISEFLGTLRNFGRLHDICIWVVAHPKKLVKRDDGQYPVPTPYDISGSAHWRNKADVCVSVWRKMGNAVDPGVHIHVQKVRNKNLGTTGTAALSWDRPTGIFSNDIE